MTRSELELVRDRFAFLHDAQKKNCDDDGCGGCKEDAEAMALIDTELAQPESREWRVTYETNEGKCAGSPWDSEADALRVKALIATLAVVVAALAFVLIGFMQGARL